MIARGTSRLLMTLALAATLTSGCSDDASDKPTTTPTSTGSPSPEAVPKGFDACSLFTTADVEKLTGQDVAAGETAIASLTPPAGISDVSKCDWQAAKEGDLPLFSIAVGTVSDLTKAKAYYDDLAKAKLGTLETGVGIRAVSTSVDATFSMSAISEKTYVVALCNTAGKGSSEEHTKRNRDTCSVPAIKKVLARFG
jgi:hypothetical protein